MTDEQTTPRSEPELLPVVSTTIAEYSPIAAGLAELRAQVEAHLPSLDCSTPAGDKLARQSRFALVKLRTSLEERRKEIKAPALQRCNEIDAEAKRITREIEKLEEPFDVAIRAQEAKVAAAKAEADRREQARKQAVEAEINALRLLPTTLLAATPDQVATELDRVQSLSFGHLEDPVERDRALTAQRETLGALTAIHASRVQHEHEQAKIASDRAENERIAREAADRRAAEDAARAEQQAREDTERAVRQAEEERAAAEQRAAEQAEGERRRRNEDTIRRIREQPVALFQATASVLEQAIASINDTSARDAGVDDDYVDQFIAASVEARARLQQMLAEQQRRDADAAEYRELQAKKAEEDRLAAQLAEKQREEREAEAIATATLRDAAEDALNLLLQFVDEDNLTVRKLGAALARDVQP